jgi:hypothetical protein
MYLPHRQLRWVYSLSAEAYETAVKITVHLFIYSDGGIMAAATSGLGAGRANVPPAPAGIVPPAPAVAPAPTAPVLTFSDRYRDIRFDSEQDSYGRLLTNFNPMAPNALTPAELLDSILQEDDGNSRAIAIHWQDPNVPKDPGQIVVVHGIKRYPRSPGGVGTLWDNKIFGWYQDVVSDSAPTVLQFPTGNIFSVAKPTNGVVTYRIYDAATLTALFTADPTLVVAPVPGAGAAGTEVVSTRHAFPVPFRYVANARGNSSNSFTHR